MNYSLHILYPDRIRELTNMIHHFLRIFVEWCVVNTVQQSDSQICENLLCLRGHCLHIHECVLIDCTPSTEILPDQEHSVHYLYLALVKQRRCDEALFDMQYIPAKHFKHSGGAFASPSSQPPMQRR